jgi:predicted RNase H-like HicB family nuclease
MIIIERQPEGEYLVSPPALPGCYTEGSTLEEARCPSVTKPGTSGLVTV